MQKTKVRYDQSALEVLANRYGFSINYIQKCLRGDRTGTQPDLLKKEYPIIVRELESAKKALSTASIK